jgi:hypothetical protein
LQNQQFQRSQQPPGRSNGCAAGCHHQHQLPPALTPRLRLTTRSRCSGRRSGTLPVTPVMPIMPVVPVMPVGPAGSAPAPIVPVSPPGQAQIGIGFSLVLDRSLLLRANGLDALAQALGGVWRNGFSFGRKRAQKRSRQHDSAGTCPYQLAQTLLDSLAASRPITIHRRHLLQNPGLPDSRKQANDSQTFSGMECMMPVGRSQSKVGGREYLIDRVRPLGNQRLMVTRRGRNVDTILDFSLPSLSDLRAPIQSKGLPCDCDPHHS